MILIVQVYGVQPNSSALVYSNAIQTVKVIMFQFSGAYFVLGTFSSTLEASSEMHEEYCGKHSSGCSVEDWNGQPQHYL